MKYHVLTLAKIVKRWTASRHESYKIDYVRLHTHTHTGDEPCVPALAINPIYPPDLVSCMFREPMYTETKNIQIKFAVNQTRLIPARLVSK